MNRNSILLVVFCLFSSSASGGNSQVTVKGIRGYIDPDKVCAVISFKLSSGCMADFMMTESAIIRFCDDLGTNLGSKPANQSPDYLKMPYYYSIGSSFGDDADEGLFTVDVVSPLKTAPGARSLTLEGELKIKCADRDFTNEVNNLTLNEGTIFSVGPHQAKVTKVTRKENGTEFDAEFVTPPEDFEIRDIDLFDAAGKEISASSQKTRAKLGEGPSTYKLWFYGIEGNPASVNMKCMQWIGLTMINVPFSVTVPLGSSSDQAMSSKPALSPPSQPVQSAGSAQGTEASKLPASADTQKPKPAAVVEPKLQASGWPALKISGVMGSGKNGTAIINGKMLGVGELINGAKVEAISGGSVTFEYQGKTKTLRSGQSTM